MALKYRGESAASHFHLKPVDVLRVLLLHQARLFDKPLDLIEWPKTITLFLRLHQDQSQANDRILLDDTSFELLVEQANIV